MWLKRVFVWFLINTFYYFCNGFHKFVFFFFFFSIVHKLCLKLANQVINQNYSDSSIVYTNNMIPIDDDVESSILVSTFLHVRFTIVERMSKL